MSNDVAVQYVRFSNLQVVISLEGRLVQYMNCLLTSMSFASLFQNEFRSLILSFKCVAMTNLQYT